MIKKKTVFVVGAGASAPYGFPTGAGLASNIIEGLSKGNAIFNTLQGIDGITSDALLSFRSAFSQSGTSSIDQFLEYRENLRDLGRKIIAAALIPHEISGRLIQMNDSWLRYVFERMSTKYEAFGENSIAFVTFNYDRTIEHFLHTSIKNKYDKNNLEAAETLSRIPIIHPHGQLGPLPWQAKDGYREYDINSTAEMIRIASRGIRIIHDDIATDDPDFVRARDVLREAEQVCLIGFGYDPTNMERIGIPSLPQPRISGTGFNMVSGERSRAIQASGKALDIYSADCLGFMRDNVDWG